MSEISVSFGGKFPRGFKLDLDDVTESDIRIKEDLKKNSFYEKEVTDFFFAALRPGDTAVDVGANVGWFTVLAATLVGPQGKVLSVEPSSGNLAKLKKNVLINDFRHVQIIEGAMSDHLRGADFYINPDGNGGCALWDASQKKITEAVKTLTLDSLELRSVRLIKLDTEGHENRILAGAKDLLSGPHRPPFIVAELHPQGLNEFGDSQLTLCQLIESHGYLSFLLPQEQGFPVFIPPTTQVKTDYILNILFARPEAMHEIYPVIQTSVKGKT